MLSIGYSVRVGIIKNKIKKTNTRRVGLRTREREGIEFALLICAPIEKKFNKARFLLSNYLCKPTYNMPTVRFACYLNEIGNFLILAMCCIFSLLTYSLENVLGKAYVYISN